MPLKWRVSLAAALLLIALGGGCTRAEVPVPAQPTERILRWLGPERKLNYGLSDRYSKENLEVIAVFRREIEKYGIKQSADGKYALSVSKYKGSRVYVGEPMYDHTNPDRVRHGVSFSRYNSNVCIVAFIYRNAKKDEIIRISMEFLWNGDSLDEAVIQDCVSIFIGEGGGHVRNY